jgi:serine/threonine-protein kinase HipA
MRKAIVKIHDNLAGILTEHSFKHYVFQYGADYQGPPISLTMPVTDRPYEFEAFPPFFDGLLPEGIQLEGLLKKHKIDKTDYFSQLLITGQDLVGAVTVEKFNPENE